jgi:hypothetical protein
MSVARLSSLVGKWDDSWTFALKEYPQVSWEAGDLQGSDVINVFSQAYPEGNRYF